MARLAAGLEDRHPEEVLARAFLGEVVAFEVEEDVAGRGLGQAGEAAALFDGQQLVDGRVGAAPRELDAGLALRLLERLLRALGRLERDGEDEVAEALEGLDVVRLELAPVEARDAGDEGEVVVGVTALVARLPPAADVAVVDGLGVVGGHERCRVGCGRFFEAPLDEAVVGGEVGDAVLLRGDGRDDVEELGLDALQGAEEVGVEAELEDGGAAGFAGELRVDGFVGEGAEGAGLLDLLEDVGHSRTSRRPRAHPARWRAAPPSSRRGCRATASAPPNCRGRGRREPSAFSIFPEVLLLVGEAPGDEEVEEGVGVLRRLRALAERDLDVEAGEMPAREELAEVGGGEGEASRRRRGASGTPASACGLHQFPRRLSEGHSAITAGRPLQRAASEVRSRRPRLSDR